MPLPKLASIRTAPPGSDSKIGETVKRTATPTTAADSPVETLAQEEHYTNSDQNSPKDSILERLLSESDSGSDVEPEITAVVVVPKKEVLEDTKSKDPAESDLLCHPVSPADRELENDYYGC